MALIAAGFVAVDVAKEENIECYAVAFRSVQAESRRQALDKFIEAQGGNPDRWELDGWWATTTGTGVGGGPFASFHLRKEAGGSYGFGACSHT